MIALQRRPQRKVLFVVIPLLILGMVFAFRYRQSDGQWVDDLKISLVTEPDPPRIGENLLRVRIRDRSGAPLTGMRVIFAYFEVPPEYMVPQEDPVVTVPAALQADNTYTAVVKLDKATAWKVAVEVYRPDRPEPTIAWFTIE